MQLNLGLLRVKQLFWAICMVAVVGITTAEAKVPVEVWADTEEISDLDMSPNGKRIAMLKRTDVGGNHDLVFFDTEDMAGSLQVVKASEEFRPVDVFWANNRYVVIHFLVEVTINSQLIDRYRVVGYDTEKMRPVSFIPSARGNPLSIASSTIATSLQAQVVSQLRTDPEHVIVAYSQAGDPTEYYKVAVANGARKLVLRGNTRLGGYVFDVKGEARGATGYDPDGPQVVTYVRQPGSSDWTPLGSLDARSRNRFGLLGFFNPKNPDEAVVLMDEDGVNTAGIYLADVSRGKIGELLFRTEQYDAVTVVTSPYEDSFGQMMGFVYADHEGYQRYIYNERLFKLYRAIDKAFQGTNNSIRRVSRDGKTILIFTEGPQDPGSYYLLRNGKAAKIAAAESRIKKSDLSPVETIVYEARDGRTISGYVTIPAGEKPFPGIVMPHGGPWVRDTYGYDEWAQMLAHQGYVVFQPNYRGSEDLGKDHWLAGDKQWGLSMQDDMEDGMLYLVEQGLVDKSKMAFFGWSYGGYAAMVAATREPQLFRCAVAGAGVADLSRIRGGLTGSRFLRVFQQPTIDGVTPLDNVKQNKVPVLLVHGDEDFTVPVEHSRLFNSALRSNGSSVDYIEIEEMGHSPWWYEWNMQWFPRLLSFMKDDCGLGARE